MRHVNGVVFKCFDVWLVNGSTIWRHWIQEQLHEDERRKDEGISHTIRTSGACGDPEVRILLSSGLQTLSILHMPSSRARGVGVYVATPLNNGNPPRSSKKLRAKLKCEFAA